MKTSTRLLICVWLTISGFLGYSQQNKMAPQSFVIKGTVKNLTDTAWTFDYTSFFKTALATVMVKPDGSFFKTINITGTSDLYLYLNEDAVVTFANPGDTLTLNWDKKDFKNTFRVGLNTPMRQNENDLMMDLHWNYREQMMQITENLGSKTIPDSVKLKQINNLLTEQIKTALKYPNTVYWQKVVYDIYFKDKSQLLKSLNRISKRNYELSLDQALTDSLKKHYIYRFKGIEMGLDERLFMKSVDYREFIAGKVMDVSPFNSVTYESGKVEREETNFTMAHCYEGMGVLNQSPIIRDWFITNTLINGFGHYKFELVEKAYNKFLPEITNVAFKDSLTTYYNKLTKTLKPGTVAPAFALMDMNGKKVSLADFEGKVVYIDFWGVSCGPCIYDTKTYAAGFHQKYKDKDIVYLNICVEGSNKEWKSKVAELSMRGVNLIAPGWVENPVCKAYNVTSIPHYVLVDSKGKIANNNAPRMGELLNNGKELDQLLAVK
jgi:peroxiredoxin